MKLIVCETVAAIVLHLREDDGTSKPGGGLKCNEVLFCKPKSPINNGWDTKIPVPKDPAEARAVTQAPRFCSACIDEWEKRLKVKDPSTSG